MVIDTKAFNKFKIPSRDSQMMGWNPKWGQNGHYVGSQRGHAVGGVANVLARNECTNIQTRGIQTRGIKIQCMPSMYSTVASKRGVHGAM